MKIVVQKFGGISVAGVAQIKNVAKLVKSEIECGNKVVAVVSAMAGVTSSIVAKCSQLSKLDNNMNMREYDAASASGEIITSCLLALCLQNIGLSSKSLQGWQVLSTQLMLMATHLGCKLVHL